MTEPQPHLLLAALTFGLSAGFSPGPLLTLVLSETLQYGPGAGIRVAISPLITDLPIIIVALVILSQIADADILLGAISLAGAGFIAHMAVKSIRFSGTVSDPENAAQRSLRKGVIANLLNPSPYLFWFSVGGPLMMGDSRAALLDIVLFLVIFYTCLVGAKALVAWLAGKSRRILHSRVYVALIRLLGIVLLVFAVIFLKNGLEKIGMPFG